MPQQGGPVGSYGENFYYIVGSYLGGCKAAIDNWHLLASIIFFY